MTDSSISRLGSQSFTPPKPVTLREPVRKRVPRETPSMPEPSKPFVAPEPVALAVTEPEPEPEVSPEPVKPERRAAIRQQLAQSAREPATAQDAASDAPPPSETGFSLRKRLAVLLAAIAVPAMASTSTGNFGAEPGAAPTEAETYAALGSEKAMPFEQVGMSFPGSAFFYVDDSSEESLVALPAADPLDFGGEFGREIGSMIEAGPAARAFFVAGSGVSQARAQQCLAEAVWYEAGTESEAGQRAVAQVVLNRVAHPDWPSSVCGVVYEGSQRSTGCQFSFTCDGSLSRTASGASWKRAQQIAADALDGKTYAPIGLATHYHARWMTPYWASSLDPIGSIGAHRFYRVRGAAGEKKAFTGTYSGIEPSVGGRVPVGPSSRPSRASSTALPSFSQTPGSRATTRGAPSAAPAGAQASQPEPGTQDGAQVVAAPAIAEPVVRGSGAVKEQYSNAGKWKARPGSAQPSGAPAQPASSD